MEKLDFYETNLDWDNLTSHDLIYKRVILIYDKCEIVYTIIFNEYPNFGALYHIMCAVATDKNNSYEMADTLKLIIKVVSVEECLRKNYGNIRKRS